MKEIITPRNAKVMTVIAMTLFGFLGLFTRYIDLPASVIVASRGILGALFLLMFIYLTGSRISRDDIYSNMFSLICSGVCLGLNWLFLFEAFKSIEISVANVLNYMTPVIVILISPLVFKTRLTVSKLLCALTAIFGLILVTGLLEEGSIDANSYGITCGILAAVFYTGLVIFNKKLRSIGSFDRTFTQLLIAGILVFAYTLVTVNYSTLTFDAATVGMLVLMALFLTALTFTLYFGSLAYLDASTSAVYTYLEPLVGILLGVTVLNEDLGILGWIGAALILGSTLLSELWDQRMQKKNSDEG
jgi:drug/metabolite transporter (DMT)-like permease